LKIPNARIARRIYFFMIVGFGKKVKKLLADIPALGGLNMANLPPPKNHQL
jgi:hypothetical protein